MPKITISNYVFFIAALCSMSVSYLLFGFSSLAFAGISVIHAFTIHSAKNKNGDYFYTLIWVFITVLACYIGFEFKLSLVFYLFLFLVSSYYYLSYSKDPFSDKAIPFVIIFASLGTTLKSVDYQLFIPYIIGTIFALIALRIGYKNKLDFRGLKSGLFSSSLYANRNRHIILSSFVYSIFLFLSLFLPEYLELKRVYWSALTFVFLLPPQGKDIIKNTILRFLGGVLAAFAVVFIVNIELGTRILGFIIILIFMFLYPTFNNSTRLIKTFSLSLLILLLLEYSFFWSDPNYTLPDTRIYETFIGGCIALAASFVLNLLDKYRRHN